MTSGPPMLVVDGLRVAIARADRTVYPVDGVSFSVAPGECLGIVGESGSGKSLTLKSLSGVLPRAASMADGSLRLAPVAGDEPAPFDPTAAHSNGVTMVFQEPMTALNPTMRIGDLVAESIVVQRGVRRAEARSNALELMREVGIPDPESRAQAWPHELSGGLRQRVMIAMALGGGPRVLLCDEPTTALDVTIQDQILRLIDRLRRDRGLSVVFVTHDLAVISQIAQRVAVMYAGQIIEEGPVADVLTEPRHAYTQKLLRSIPTVDHAARAGDGHLVAIVGAPPDPGSFGFGCRFSPRCSMSIAACNAEERHLVMIAPGRTTACVRHAELSRR
jgi:oligopeptide/dipeptide ABC transporter ATP-binding protein